MSRKEFGYLLRQYAEGKCTEEERNFVEHWYALIQNEEREEIEESELDALEPLMWQQIQKRTHAESEIPVLPIQKGRSFPIGWLAGLAAAAVIVLGIFLNWGGGRKFFPAGMSEARSDWTKKTNTTSSPMLVTLPDGSEITLSPNSTVEYQPGSLHTKREVYLTGDAFFEVVKNPSKPFSVYTGKVVTRVLGTSFFVKAGKKSEQVSVEVVTGRVAVYEGSETEKEPEAILTPNQKIIYSNSNHEFALGLVELPKPLPTAAPDEHPAIFSFEDTPMHTVVDRLKQTYGIDIDLVNDNLKNCPLTADLTNFSLYQQLDMICAATKSHYEVKGTKIVISGAGCAYMQ